jgi:2-polyprenyl-6-methoxyphenol hydroxylase-like FAD-dependent oxidoreductase
MTVVKNVLVVGGGIGGLSAAVALKQKGIDAEIVELNERWQVYHVGIIVQGNFLVAMDALGVADKAIEAGFPYEGIHHCDINGNRLYSQPPIKVGSAKYAANLGLTRPALHKILTDAVRAEDIPVRLGVTVKDMVEGPGGIAVTFTDGTSGRYDLVVGADGVKSQMRRRLFGEDYKPAFTGQGVWRYNIPRPADFVDMELFRGKPGATAGLVPLDESSMYVFYVAGEPGNPRFQPETLADELRNRLEGYGGLMAKVRDQIIDPALVVYRPLETLLMPDPWYRGRTVLIGDAAHSTTPHMGQGAALAVEDSVVLADELSKASSVDGALAAFMKRRFDRVKTIVDNSILLGEGEMNPEMKVNVPEVYGRAFAVLAQPA